MGKKFIEKIASCNANGELRVAPVFLEEMYVNLNMEELCSGTKGMESALSLAILCRENGEEREAVTILHDIWRNTFSAKGIPSPNISHIREKIKREVSILYFSPDECVWEECSQFF